MTARMHSMFWLTIPGLAILTKMAEYLNAYPTYAAVDQTLGTLVSAIAADPKACPAQMVYHWILEQTFLCAG